MRSPIIDVGGGGGDDSGYCDDDDDDGCVLVYFVITMPTSGDDVTHIAYLYLNYSKHQAYLKPRTSFRQRSKILRSMFFAFTIDQENTFQAITSDVCKSLTNDIDSPDIPTLHKNVKF
jgi:hypothetical protein